MTIEQQAAEVRKVKRSESGMISDPITLHKDALVMEAVKLMRDFGIGGIPVVDKKNILLGILTNRDLRFEKNHNRRISEIMTKENLITTTGVKDLKEAENILQNYKIEKLPVIDKKGNLVWHGNSTVALDQVLQEVLSGKLDVESARRTVTAEKLIREYYMIASTGLTNSRLAELGDQIITNATKYPSILNEFAWRILTDRTVKTKDYKLALRASQAAYELSGNLVPVMDTYARALFQNGRHAEAIEMEKKAIAACDDTRFRPDLESVLLRFQRLSRANGKK